MGKRISFHILRKKLEKSWARSDMIQVIDVGNDFYFVRFHSLEDYGFASTGGSWLIFNHYLTVHQWDAQFNAYTASIHKLAVWIQLPGLAMENYDEASLERIGNLIETNLKVDTNIAQRAREN